MNNSLISIIIPVYNVEEYLNTCIESVISQTYKNLEIILVDDGSQDNCSAICDEWKTKDQRIVVIHKDNGGLSDARNAGLRIAKGDYIGFVDSDDWIAPEMYERLLWALLSDKSEISACTVQMVWEDNSEKRFLTVKKNLILEQKQAQEALLDETLIKQPVWYKLYKKEVVENVLFEKGKQHEDVFWSYQVIDKAKRISLIDYIGYFYRQRSNSIMGTQFSIKRLDALEAKCSRYVFFKTHCPELESKSLISIWTSIIYYGQMTLMYSSKDEQNKVFEILQEVQKAYPIKRVDYCELKISHQLWILGMKWSLLGICRLKNFLKVGL